MDDDGLVYQQAYYKLQSQNAELLDLLRWGVLIAPELVQIEHPNAYKLQKLLEQEKGDER